MKHAQDKEDEEPQTSSSTCKQSLYVGMWRRRNSEGDRSECQRSLLKRAREHRKNESLLPGTVARICHWIIGIEKWSVHFLLIKERSGHAFYLYSILYREYMYV
jgi:hypothetical protein